MKVILVNGSPHPKGCTHTALEEVADALQAEGIETEEFWIGPRPLSGCLACGGCRRNAAPRCIFDDTVNAFLDKEGEADGFIFGSPVHYADVGGAVKSFMDRAFYAAGKAFAGKPAAGIVSCRRGGASAAFDTLNKYFTINNMPVVPSCYWNQVHGNTPDEVRRDEEGMQTMRVLGQNMAWLLKCIDAGRAAGVPYPVYEPRIHTNYIR